VLSQTDHSAKAEGSRRPTIFVAIQLLAPLKRWNIVTMGNFSRLVLISARPSGSPTVGGLRYIVPPNLRTIGGM
jgi:hypothetical protein